MIVGFQLAEAVVVATLALAPVPAGSSVAQQVGTDNPPPNATVLQSAQALGPASESTSSGAEPVEKNIAREGTAAQRTDGKKNTKYDINMIGRREVAHGLNFYSIEREQSLGKQLSSEVEAQVKLVDDPAVNDYVNGLVQRLVQNSDAKVPFTVRVIDDAEVNAFALPGGFLYVHTGLIQAADNEAELASVIAHEIAHVAARHVTRARSRSSLWDIASIPLVFVPAGLAVRQVVGIASPLSALKFSRDAEREADLLGMEYGYHAGYDPVALIQIFERLRAGEPNKTSALARAFMCHPTSADRIQRAQRAIVTYLPSRDAYIVNTSAFDEVKARLGRLGLTDPKGAFGRPVLRQRADSVISKEQKETHK